MEEDQGARLCFAAPETGDWSLMEEDILILYDRRRAHVCLMSCSDLLLALMIMNEARAREWEITGNILINPIPHPASPPFPQAHTQRKKDTETASAIHHMT